MSITDLPVLYSFRRCPYAMRARLAIYASGIPIELREVLLKHKPPEMLEASPKGTVPVLLPHGDRVIDESADIMLWALKQSDPFALLPNQLDPALEWIARNDNEFKPILDRYKYSDRYPEHSQAYYCGQAMAFLTDLDRNISPEGWLAGRFPGLADISLLPFVRQFAMVDKVWFDSVDLPAVQHWLDEFLASVWFRSIMKKYPLWEGGQQGILFQREQNSLL